MFADWVINTPLQESRDSALQFHAEVVSSDREAFSKIETMCMFALHARVEVQLVALLTARFFAQPIEQSLAIAFRATALICDEIINVKDAATVQHLHKSISRHRSNDAVVSHGRETIALGIHHPTHSGEVIVRRDVRAELPHDFARRKNIFIGLDSIDDHISIHSMHQMLKLRR